MIKKGEDVYKCVKCGLKLELLVLGKIDGYIDECNVVYVKLINVDLNALPEVVREAVETLDERKIKKALGYTGPLRCPHCGGVGSYKGWKGSLRRYKCSECGREYTVKTFIKLAKRERRPVCPHCGSNENVVKNGRDNKGVQRFLCRKCSRYFRETTAIGSGGPYWDAALEYVSKGVSVKTLCEERKISPNKLFNSIKALADMVEGIVYNRRKKPGILIIDDSKHYLNGR